MWWRTCEKAWATGHGWVVFDKPLGMTSTQAVGKIRRLFDAEKAGHGGTLDPLATGMLPIALGEATKTVQWAMDGRKVYRFEVTWGAERTTDDMEGAITTQSELRPTKESIESILIEFQAEILQAPAFFTIKSDGERAYDLPCWREGLDGGAASEHRKLFWSCPDAIMRFLRLLRQGNYVRSLARTGAKMGCLAIFHVSRDCRGLFSEADLNSADSLRN